MFPLDLRLLQKFVGSSVRQRGADYASSGAVKLIRRTGDGALAIVAGGREYRVQLRYADGALFCRCDCPFFEGEDTCKHIWATLIECQRSGVTFSGRVTALVDDPEGEADDDVDDVDDETDVVDEETDAVENQLRRIESRLRVLRTGQPDAASGRNQPRLKLVPPQPRSRWREQIARLRSWPVNATHRVAPLPEITWVIDPRTIGEGVTLEITTRPTKKNGEPGRPQPLTIDRLDIATLADPLDREILALIFGQYAYRESRVRIGSPLAQFVIPKVASTGRLLMRVDKAEYVGTTMDSGGPYDLAVRAEDRGDDFLLVATLCRGEETVPLSDALTFSSDSSARCASQSE